jgi:hypothetical protein
MARGNLRIERWLIGGVVLEILHVNPRKIFMNRLTEAFRDTRVEALIHSLPMWRA